MRKSKAIYLLFSLVWVISSCVKDGSSTDSKLIYAANAINLSSSLKNSGSESGVVVPAGTSGSINWVSAKVNISQMEFSTNHLGANSSYTTDNVFIPDALKANFFVGEVPVSSGVYESNRFKLTLKESATAPPILLNGNYIEASGTVIPVELKFNMNQSMVLENGRIEISTGNYIASVKLELNNLVKGLTASDFGQTTRSGTNNSISINSVANRPLFEKLLVRLPSALSINVSKQ